MRIGSIVSIKDLGGGGRGNSIVVFASHLQIPCLSFIFPEVRELQTCPEWWDPLLPTPTVAINHHSDPTNIAPVLFWSRQKHRQTISQIFEFFYYPLTKCGWPCVNLAIKLRFPGGFFACGVCPLCLVGSPPPALQRESGFPPWLWVDGQRRRDKTIPPNNLGYTSTRPTTIPSTYACWNAGSRKMTEFEQPCTWLGAWIGDQSIQIYVTGEWTTNCRLTCALALPHYYGCNKSVFFMGKRIMCYLKKIQKQMFIFCTYFEKECLFSLKRRLCHHLRGSFLSWQTGDTGRSDSLYASIPEKWCSPGEEKRKKKKKQLALFGKELCGQKR